MAILQLLAAHGKQRRAADLLAKYTLENIRFLLAMLGRTTPSLVK